MAKLSQLNLPIKDESTGQVTSQTFDIGGKEYTAGYGIDIDENDEIKSATFVGTTAEWNALTSEQQNAYDERVLTDDTVESRIFDTVPTSGSNNGITSGGVYTALSAKADSSSLGTAATKDFTTAVTSDSADLVTSGAVYENIKEINDTIPDKGFSNVWSTKTWSGMTSFSSGDIWTDGENIYYSRGYSQYVLDKATSTWSDKTWNTLRSFSGGNIWTDGTDIYYSVSSAHFVLDKSTSTWNTKTWTGLTSFGGGDIWTDGENIYYSYSSNQYVLDKSTSTWSVKTWNGLASLYVYCIWSDGENFHYYDDNNLIDYVLNKATSTWSDSGLSLPRFAPEDVWTDGENTYYSDGRFNWVFDKSTSTWVDKTWSGLTSFTGDYIWTDGDNIYYSYSLTQYVLNKEKGFGTAASKDSTDVIANGSKDLVTSGAVYAALQSVALVPWAYATDSEVAAMVNAYYNDELTLNDIKSVWNVGDVRTITLGSIAANNVGESHRMQNVDIVILDFEHDDLTTAINGHTKALISVQLKNCLRDATVSDYGGENNTENGYINSTGTNAGGWTSSARRTWCNNYFYNAIPMSMRGLIKQVNKLTSAGNRASTINTDADYCWLLSEIEVFGTVTNSISGEGSQYKYFETAANIRKFPSWRSGYISTWWWERSPYSASSSFFCGVNYHGMTDNASASIAYGLAPAWCL